MVEVRHTHTATLLPDGTVLVTGGDGGMTEAGETINLASTELYDPASGTWTAAASMELARRWHSATLLPDGAVLVAGGAGENPRLGGLSRALPARATGLTASGRPKRRQAR